MIRARALPWSLALLGLLMALPAAAPPAPARRVVSLVPAVTEILFSIGAGADVVGVSSFDKHPPEAATRTRVGALVDPDIERIFSLKPDLVVIYASQEELAAQLSRAGIRAYAYKHGGLDQITATMRELGATTGHGADAERTASAFAGAIDRVRAAVRDRARPRTMVVFGREPMSLRNVYASGGTGFLHEALIAAGGRNVFEDVARESVQASSELIIARAPEAIVELRAVGLIDAATRAREEDIWRRLSSLPAVKGGRVHVIDGSALVVPGPRLADGIATLARVLHPGAL